MVLGPQNYEHGNLEKQRAGGSTEAEITPLPAKYLKALFYRGTGDHTGHHTGDHAGDHTGNHTDDQTGDHTEKHTGDHLPRILDPRTPPPETTGDPGSPPATGTNSEIGRKRRPLLCFRGPWRKHVTLIAWSAARGRNLRPLLRFRCPGAKTCNFGCVTGLPGAKQVTAATFSGHPPE